MALSLTSPKPTKWIAGTTITSGEKASTTGVSFWTNCVFCEPFWNTNNTTSPVPFSIGKNATHSDLLGLTGTMTGDDGGGTNTNFTWATSANSTTAPNGVYLDITATWAGGQNIDYPCASITSGTTLVSGVVLFNANAMAGADEYMQLISIGGDAGGDLAVFYNPVQSILQIGKAGYANYFGLRVASVPTGAWRCFGFSVNLSTGATIIALDGAKPTLTVPGGQTEATAMQTAFTAINTHPSVRLYNGWFNGRTIFTKMAFAAAWVGRVLTQTELNTLTANPYQMIEQGGGGSPPVTPTGSCAIIGV